MTEYTPIAGLNNIYCVHKGNLRSIALVLRDKSVCVVSPISGLTKPAYAPLAAIGKVSHVLAPNHYHHKGIADFTKQFPKAKAYANESAIERLQAQTKRRFNSLDNLKPLLERGSTLLEPKGLKTGEIWLRFNTPKLKAWMVVDAFCGPKLKKTAVEEKQPELLKTFPNYGIGDKAGYSGWATKQVDKDKPTLLIPCHGSVVRSPKLPASLKGLLKSLNK